MKRPLWARKKLMRMFSGRLPNCGFSYGQSARRRGQTRLASDTEPMPCFLRDLTGRYGSDRRTMHCMRAT